MADKAQKDMEQALTSLVEHPGWALVVAYAESARANSVDAMTSNPAGKIWEHGLNRGYAQCAVDLVGYPAAALAQMRAVQEAVDQEDEES